MSIFSKRPLVSIFLLLSGLPSLMAADPGIDSFLKKHCVECHDADMKKGGVRLDQLSPQRVGPEHLHLLTRIFDRVQAGEMPPKKADQPSPESRQVLLSELGKKLLATEAVLAGPSGRTLVRRMNRVEYENTLRDLLALPLLRVKELLPEDGQQFGFDKVAGGLDISHIQMSKYLLTADAALRQAVVKAASRPETKTWRESAARQDTVRAAIAVHAGVPLVGRELAPGLTTHVVGNPAADYGNTYRGASFNGNADSVAVLTGVIGAHQPEGIQIDHFKPTVPGWYQVRFSTWSLRWERTKAVAAVRGTARNYTIFSPPYFKNDSGQWSFTRLPKEKLEGEWKENIEFYGNSEVTQIVRASLKGKVIGFFDAPSLAPKVHEFKVWLNPGERISFHAMTLPAHGANNSGVNEGVVSYEGPALAYDWFEVTGPLVEQWPPESQRRLFGEIPVNAYPRPPLASAPTLEAGATSPLRLSELKGPGQMFGDERYLNTNGTVATTVNCPVPGEYELGVGAYETHAGDESAKMTLMLGENEMPHARFSVDSQRGKPKVFRAKFRVDSAGPVTLGVQFTNDFFDEKHADPNLRDRNLFLTSIEVTAPKPQQSHAAADQPEGHRGLLLDFAARAFRRPVTASEVAPYGAIIEAELKRGASFELAMLAGYKAILCAPDFLMIGLESGVSQATKDGLSKLGDYALASRLSYFLWNSMPDETLLELAKNKSISQPGVLKAQVDRMLADPRSERFIEHFLDEWLELKKIEVTTPDPNLYPEFDPWLLDSMLEEPRATFRRMLTKNLEVREVVASDTILINQRLAELYGIRGIAGAELREVKVPAGMPRGGFMTQAAVLKVTANGTATSPVLRGVWVMERILGIPRQPPPPNIPAVEPDATGAVTIRQMIEKHRADSACASCHAKMDPPGLALESFDVIGGWRDRYRLAGQPGKIRKGNEETQEPFVEVVGGAAHRNRVKLRLGSEVDATGELADGRKFSDVNGLRELLLHNEDALANNVAKQLMIYATGAGIRFSDRAAIDAIVAKTKPARHGLRSIVQEVVASELFQSK